MMTQLGTPKGTVSAALGIPQHRFHFQVDNLSFPITTPAPPDPTPPDSFSHPA